MRVITGTAGGMRLQTLDGESTRPTTEKVKEAIFSSIQFDIEGKRVLDLFSGSGQMGIEALSRGAKSCVFVDKERAAASVIKNNLEKTRLSNSAKVVQSDAVSFLDRQIEVFDLVFLDPPYSCGLLEKALAKVYMNMSNGAILFAEHPVNDILPDEIGQLKKIKDYRYGKIAVTRYEVRR